MRLIKRAALVIPVAVALAGCNVWTMYGGGPTHTSHDSSNVITTSTIATLTEAGTTAAATGSNSWIDSSPTVASNGDLYATANYADAGDCAGIKDPNDVSLSDLYPNETKEPIAPNDSRIRPASCTHTPRAAARQLSDPNSGPSDIELPAHLDGNSHANERADDITGCRHLPLHPCGVCREP